VEQFVTIKNANEEEPFIGKYDGEYITIPAGGSKIVQWDVMVVWMGDPRIENTDRYAERREVYNNICAKWHARGLTGNTPEDLPALEAYTEDGERILTVMDDPEGEMMVPVSREGDGDVGKLQRQIDRLQARLEERLNGLVDAPSDAPENDSRSRAEGEIAAEIAAEDAELNGENIADDAEDELDIPEDTPAKIPVGKAAPGKAPAKRGPVKAPPSKPRRTAGTAGKRAAARQK
jgi:hypothetical protein